MDAALSVPCMHGLSCGARQAIIFSYTPIVKAYLPLPLGRSTLTTLTILNLK